MVCAQSVVVSAPAAREPELPYLLLLDEMNSLMLSATSRTSYPAWKLETQSSRTWLRAIDGEWRLESSSEPLIPIPRNVFVVGTVNVDETTYQFSPKVLDRATTFEVRTRTDELAHDLARPIAVPPASVPHLRALVNHVLDDTWQSS